MNELKKNTKINLVQNHSHTFNFKYASVRNTKKQGYINLPCSFDIETTSTYIQGEKVAFMYVWSFGILDIENNIHFYQGRTWEEFIQFCKDLSEYLQLNEKLNLICYVHNLGFEFQFMRKYFNWLKVFSVDERKPLKALCDLGIEFRCSYILSGYNLDTMAKNLTSHKIDKLIGSLDYELVRHKDTIITKDEQNYIINDIVIILYYINEELASNGNNISRIPLTNTGRVRSFVRNKCLYSNKNHKKTSKGKYTRYRKIMQDLTLEVEEYTQLKRAFMGGYTHANANYTNQVLENVASIDFTSSYPSVMLSERFPMGKGRQVQIKDKEHFNYLLDNYCCLFDVEFKNITATFEHDNYLSDSKCVSHGAIINNGRIFSADSTLTTITDVDYTIIKNTYKWDSMGVQNMWIYPRGYLPKDIILSVLELYQKKTELKGVQGQEVEYLLSKGMLNSIYGMSVTDIVRDEVLYNDEWGKIPSKIDEQIETYNKSHNRFLSYAWGVWVTAYARKNLWNGIFNIKEDYIYSDTDSIKLLNYDKHHEYINWYNENIKNKLYAMCEFYNIDVDMLKPKTIKGVEKLIGVWDFEEIYTKFKTLGAKRYLTEVNNDYHLTVAGLSKKNGVNYMIDVCNNDSDKIFNMFTNDLYVSGENTGKMTHTYIDEEMIIYVTDYKGVSREMVVKSGIHLEKCDFTLSISEQYKRFIKNFIKGYHERGTKYV